MKILFAPNDLGGGFGHISRCQALAEYLADFRFELAFMMHHEALINKVGREFQVFRTPTKSFYDKINSIISRYFGQSEGPLYIKVPELSYQVIRDGYTSVKIICRVIKRYLDVLNNFKPDLIVGDTNLLIGIAAKILNIPLIQISRKAFYPSGSRIIWWQDSHELKPPDINLLFNKVLEIYKLTPITRAEDLLSGDLYVVPSIPELEPGMNAANTFYIGPLLRSEKIKKNFNFKKNRSKVIYVTIGAGSVGNIQFFKLLTETFKGSEFDIIVSIPDRFRSLIKYNPENIHFYDWVPGREVIGQSDLVIFHGGYGTMMEIVGAGVPSLVVPFHSEQESNGRRLKENGCCEICRLSDEEEILITRSWEYGTYSYAYQNKLTLTEDQLNQKVQTLLYTEKYLRNIRQLKNKARNYKGPEDFLNIIKKYFNVI